VKMCPKVTKLPLTDPMDYFRPPGSGLGIKHFQNHNGSCPKEQGYIKSRAFCGETFRVLKEKEEREYDEYQTRHLVLEAGDKLESKWAFAIESLLRTLYILKKWKLDTDELG